VNNHDLRVVVSPDWVAADRSMLEQLMDQARR